MQYLLFETDDFCRDADFVRWVLEPTTESDRFWQTFLAEHPEKKESVLAAVRYVKAMNFREEPPNAADLEKLKKRIWTSLENTEETVRPMRRIYFWAASVVLMLSVAVGWIWLNKRPQQFVTQYNDIRTVKLADGSTVTLNSRSSLKVIDHIDHQPVREVWLEGEAYFEVAPHDQASFVVHTPETQVEVLGTGFNVNSRRAETQVVLHHGKVRLRSVGGSGVVMKPGEMVVVGKDQSLRLRRVQAEQYRAWTNNYLVMDGKTVSEIVELVQDSYGIPITVQDSALLSKKLEGKLKMDSPTDFIENFATILDRTAEKEGNGYIFR